VQQNVIATNNIPVSEQPDDNSLTSFLPALLAAIPGACPLLGAPRNVTLLAYQLFGDVSITVRFPSFPLVTLSATVHSTVYQRTPGSSSTSTNTNSLQTLISFACPRLDASLSNSLNNRIFVQARIALDVDPSTATLPTGYTSNGPTTPYRLTSEHLLIFTDRCVDPGSFLRLRRNAEGLVTNSECVECPASGRCPGLFVYLFFSSLSLY
jgi:hypothetical protein